MQTDFLLLISHSSVILGDFFVPETKIRKKITEITVRYAQTESRHVYLIALLTSCFKHSIL